MIYPNYSINKETLDGVALLGASINDFSWKTRPNGRYKRTCLIQWFNRAPTRPGPLRTKDSVNSKDMGKPNWQCRKIVCVCVNLLHSLNPKVSHSTKIKYLEGLINLVLSSEDLPISLSGFIHIGFLSVFQTFSSL